MLLVYIVNVPDSCRIVQDLSPVYGIVQEFVPIVKDYKIFFET